MTGSLVDGHNYIDTAIEKGAKMIIVEKKDIKLEEKIDYKEVTARRLASAYSKLLFKKSIKEKEIVFDIEEDKYTIQACLDILYTKIENYNKFYFKNLFDSDSSKLEIVTYFLALLELMKLKKIKVKQKDEEIKIERIANA